MKVAPWPKRLKDLGRHRARLRRDVGNGVGVAPAGTLGHVKSSGNGWHLLRFEADPCSTCGIRWGVSRLSQRDLDLLAVDEA